MIDTVISIIKIKGIRATLDKIEELNEQIKEKMYGEFIQIMKNTAELYSK